MIAVRTDDEKELRRKYNLPPNRGAPMPGWRERNRKFTAPAATALLGLSIVAPALYGLWCLGWWAAIPIGALALSCVLMPSDPID